MSGTTFPINITSAGQTPQTPAALNALLIADVAATNPDYTANLPGSLIEDISSTDVGALLIMDSMLVDLINSVSPYTANVALLTQLGNIYGIPAYSPTNTSAFVLFSGTPGFVVPIGFVVGDGTYSYVVQDGGIIGSGGVSGSIFVLATQSGSWAVPANTIVQLQTSVPTGITLSVTNPSTGIAAGTTETEEQYRVRVLAGGLAASQGMTSYLKLFLNNVPGVQPRLVAVQQQGSGAGGGWKIIVGGGDPFQVSYAVFKAIFDISTIVGSVMAVTNITTANPGVVTTSLNHGLATGNVVVITGVLGMTGINGVSETVTVLSEKTFSVGNTTSFGSYASGGVISPNSRNITTSIIEYPDTYSITIVNPPAQTVALTLTWNTNSVQYVSPAAVVQLGNPALVNYINTLPVAQPINLFELQAVFQNAIVSLVPAQLLTRMVFAVSINGIGTSPTSGTGIIAGDPESYFITNTGLVTITQG